MTTEDDRVLAFEVGGVAWALPITEVREVTDPGRLAAVPTLPRSLVGIVNHRGDALPVVSPTAVLDVSAERIRSPTQMLVIGGSGDEPGQLGIPVDRVLGLARAPRGRRPASGVVRVRGTLDGRMLRVLDAARLLERAAEALAQARTTARARPTPDATLRREA